ncbi:Elongation of very long chain fatty acids protein 4 [Cyphomyrmex costatus]|uniref:Elongation of very long chain fatty acids protein n=1 Tax=Cyphomyrmex costatus TaxID=456900 RepID=A0A195CR98_9HYME|nr:Elongation of very long chain fatty acids protein 4 [Cyphomyrmex costatus]
MPRLRTRPNSPSPKTPSTTRQRFRPSDDDDDDNDGAVRKSQTTRFVVRRTVYLAWTESVVVNTGSVTCSRHRITPREAENTNSGKMADGVYLYFVCKLIELLDTVFFVLRKKDRQITFLHLYHHSLMPVCAWIGVKFFAGGHPTLLGVINAFVHVFMYTYYMLAAFGPHMQKYLWWKKYLTIIQIIQFIIVFFHNFQMLFTSCNFPKPLSFLLMINAGLFMYMFGSFYVNNYLKSNVGRLSKTNGAINGSVRTNAFYIIQDIANIQCDTNSIKCIFILQNCHSIYKNLFCNYTFQAMTMGWIGEFSYFCEPIDYSNTPKTREITRLVWSYFMIKVLDLMDTVFFVLRKKQSQITFLHLYHHIGIVMGTWGAVKWLPGGHVTFLGLINTFVHVIMYTHYLLAAMKINTSLWKKHITQLQLIQFFLITLHYLQLAWVEDCGFPIWPAYVMVPQNLFMIILFGDFYYKTYIKEKSAIEKVMTKMEINGISTEISNRKSKEQ